MQKYTHETATGALTAFLYAPAFDWLDVDVLGEDDVRTMLQETQFHQGWILMLPHIMGSLHVLKLCDKASLSVRGLAHFTALGQRLWGNPSHDKLLAMKHYGEKGVRPPDRELLPKLWMHS